MAKCYDRAAMVTEKSEGSIFVRSGKSQEVVYQVEKFLNST